MNNETTGNSLQTYIILRLQSFAVLREKTPDEHTSRFEAYCDLIDRAQCQNMRLDRGATKAMLKQGEVMVTYSDLSDQWHWTRAAVRRFIEDLEAAGLAKKRPFMKSYIIFLPIHVLPQQLAESDTDNQKDEDTDRITRQTSSLKSDADSDFSVPATGSGCETDTDKG